VDRPYVELATLYAAAGRGDVAQRLMEEYGRVVDPWERGHVAGERMEFGSLFDDSIAVAEIALAHGRTEEAIARLRRYLEGPRCELCGLFEMAQAYDVAGQPDSAAVYYEKTVSTPSWWRINAWSTIPVAYRRLCAYYAKKGDAANAREYCGDLVALWKDADPKLQPEVRAARQAMGEAAAH
jgi:eukaryotic-like serine/threonine-protein kinase